MKKLAMLTLAALIAAAGCASRGKPSVPPPDAADAGSIAELVLEDAAPEDTTASAPTPEPFAAFAGSRLVVGGEGAVIGERFFSGRDDIVEVVIRDGTTTIATSAFVHCKNLRSVTIPGSVTVIRDWAFGYCGNLTSVTMGEGVVTIGSLAFAYCGELASIDVAEGNAAYASVDGVLFNRDKTVLLLYPEGKKDSAYAIPSGVTAIAPKMFRKRRNLKSVTIPGSVKNIGEEAFKECENLTSVTIPASVVSIGNWAFDGPGLTSNDSKGGCTNLTSMIYLNPVPPGIKHGTFNGLPASACLYVPAGSMEAYRAADVWKGFKCIKDLESAPGGE